MYGFSPEASVWCLCTGCADFCSDVGGSWEAMRVTVLEAMGERLRRLARCGELDVPSAELPASAAGLSDESVFRALGEVAGFANDIAVLQSVLAGVAAQRSRREDGHSGLAAVHGHATPAALIQSITGGTKADATRHIRVGNALLDTSVPLEEQRDAAAPCTPERAAWHEPLRRALLDGRLTGAQLDAIRTGLGEPSATGDGHSDDAVAQAWLSLQRGSSPKREQ